MKRIKSEEFSKLSDTDLIKRLNDLRSDLSSLRSKAARGTLKKELGEIKTVRRNIARTLTQLNSRKSPSVGSSAAPRSTQVGADESTAKPTDGGQA
jgi:large subunit ribosomal protein L29